MFISGYFYQILSKFLYIYSPQIKHYTYRHLSISIFIICLPKYKGRKNMFLKIKFSDQSSWLSENCLWSSVTSNKSDWWSIMINYWDNTYDNWMPWLRPAFFSMSCHSIVSDTWSIYFQYKTVTFVCVEILLPSQPSGVMLSMVSLPNHTFTRQA